MLSRCHPPPHPGVVLIMTLIFRACRWRAVLAALSTLAAALALAVTAASPVGAQPPAPGAAPAAYWLVASHRRGFALGGAPLVRPAGGGDPLPPVTPPGA